MSGDIIVALVVVVALAFDFTNGFHDTANSMATTIATGALTPKVAVTIAALLNFVGAFISLEVATTVAGGNVPAIASPILAGLIAAAAVYMIYRIVRHYTTDHVEKEFRWAQVASSSMVALAHGTNDAQKTMGVISLALIANGTIAGGDGFDVPFWVVLSCAAAIALGTYTGGWRIMKTMGTKVVEVRPPQGFGSEAVAATVILASSHAGYPLSTTQVTAGAITGSGVGRPGAKVNWSVAKRIVGGWMLTLPAAAATSAVAYAVIDALGGQAFGVVVVAIALGVGCVLLFLANRRRAKIDPDDSVSENPAFTPAFKPTPVAA